MRNLLLIGCLTVLIPFAAVRAQSTDTTRLSSDPQLGVNKAIRIALDNSPRLKRLQAQLRYEKGQKKTSWGINNPEVYYMREGIKDNQFAEQRWAISQTLDFPLTGYYRYSMNARQVEAVNYELQARRLDLIADVKTAYTELAYAIESFHLARQQVNLGEELKKAASARFEVGESSEMDVLQAELQLADARNNLNDSQRAIQNSRYNLFEVIGLDPDQQRYEIEFPDTLAYMQININQDQVLEQLSSHPEMKSMQRRTDAAGYQVKTAKSTYLPKLRVDFYRQEYPDQSSAFDFTGFEIGFSVPLWFGLNQSGQVQSAKANLNDREWAYQQTMLQFKKEAEQAWHSYESSKSVIERYHELVRTKSERLLDMTQRGYRAGEIDLLQLLEAQRTYLENMRRYNQALRDYYLQLIRLERFLQSELVFAEGDPYTQ